MQTEIFILGSLLGLAVLAMTGMALALVRLNRRTASELNEERHRSETLAMEAAQLRGRLDTQCDELERGRERQRDHAAALAALNLRLEQQAALAAEAQAKFSERDAALAQARTHADTLSEMLEQERAVSQRRHSEQAGLQAELHHARQAQAELRAWVDAAKDNLSGAFAELAGKVFDERGQQFEKNVRLATGQSRADIETMLKPFSEKLGEFRQRVDTLYGEEARERASLLGAVGELKTLNQDMAVQAAALTSALKGNAKVRGDWGELMLDNVLRGSGLEEGKEYERQAQAVDDDGSSLRPDVVVHFPDQRSVVIDSKVNLVAWQEAMNATTPEQQDEALRRHAAGLRQHVKDLGSKNYPKAVGGDALDVTIAFVPIEGALSAALGSDQHLQTYAFDQRVVFASPNTLMALLRVTERLWTRDKVQRQAMEISDTGGKVLDALMAFLSDFDDVGKRLQAAQDAFNGARNRLTDSPQSAMKRASRLAELGSKAKRALPQELQPEKVLPLSRDATSDTGIERHQ